MKHIALLIALLPATAFAGVYNTLSGSVTHDCAKDPDVVVNASDGNITLTGTCERVVLNGGEVKMKVEAVQRIAINGADNIVDIVGVDRLAVVGSDNKVTYKKGLAGKPKISAIGTNNSITQVK